MEFVPGPTVVQKPPHVVWTIDLTLIRLSTKMGAPYLSKRLSKCNAAAL